MTGSTIRVLLVEDDEAHAYIQQRALRAESRGEADGFAVTRVGSMAEALHELRQGTYDAIVADLRLPDSEDLDTVRTLRQQAPRVSLVVLSSLKNEPVALAALRAGAQDYLYKEEISPSLLSRAIRFALERKQWEIRTYLAD